RDLHSFPTRRSSDLITAKKPTASARISTRSSWSGHAKRCATTSSTWISAKDAATYASAHCTSLRCFRRAMNSVMRRSFCGATAGYRHRNRNQRRFVFGVLIQQSLEPRIMADRIPGGVDPQHHGRVKGADDGHGQCLFEQRHGEVGAVGLGVQAGKSWHRARTVYVIVGTSHHRLRSDDGGQTSGNVAKAQFGVGDI